MIIPLQRKCLMIKAKVFIFIVINIHNNSYTVGFVTSGANVSKSNSTHFSFKTSTGHITFDISGIYEIHFKDGYKGPACNIHMSPGSVNPNIVFVYIEEINGRTSKFSILIV